MKNILIIGCGLIGSSLLRAISEKKIAKKFGDIGFKTRLWPLVHDGQNKIQLVTSGFDNRGNANTALAKIKEAKLPGMIKQRFN